MALNLIMLGPPGAGKGTQAERFGRKRGIPRLSTGDILREAVQDGTEIGRCAKAIMERGELVSDEVMIGVVRERLVEPSARVGFVLDGFPRTLPQAMVLDGIMAGRDPLIVIDIVVPEVELMRRLASRMICESCGANLDEWDDARGGSTDRIRTVLQSAVESADAPVLAETVSPRCRRCGGRLKQRVDDNAAVVHERLQVYRRRTKPLIDYYGARQTFRSVDGTQPPDRVAAALAAAVEAVEIRVAGEGSMR